MVILYQRPHGNIYGRNRCPSCGGHLVEFRDQNKELKRRCQSCQAEVSVKNAPGKGSAAGFPKAHRGVVVRDMSKEVKPKAPGNPIAPTLTPPAIGLVEGLKLVRQAMLERKVLSFTYSDLVGNVSHRSIEPYKLVGRGGKIMLYGYCLEKDAVRVFNLSNASEYQLQNFTFEPRWPVEDLLEERGMHGVVDKTGKVV